MACNSLTNNITLDCRVALGGIREIYLAAVTGGTNAIVASATSGVVTSFSVDGTSVSASSGLETTPFVRIEVPVETASMTETATYSNENGTSYYTNVLSFPVNTLDDTTQEFLKVVGQSKRLCAVALDQNDRYFLVGNDNGCVATSSTGGSGTAMTDRSGFVLELTGLHEDPAYVVEFA